jgi:hypothetical protein
VRKIIIVLTVLLQVSLAYGQVGSSTISIEDVVKEFYKKYRVTFYDGYITFEKRKSDWYIVYNTVQNNELAPRERYLFYNGKTKKFQNLQLEENKDSSEVKVSDYVQEYDIRNFNLQPYFGYAGWYKDVIKEQESKSKLTDDELYGLARAYSTYAGSLISDAAGYADKKEIWNIPFNINGLTPMQIDRFKNIGDKAIRAFKKLADRNPDYETIVGKIGMKYSNEYIYQYQLLLTYADKYASTMKLPPDLFSEQQLATAKKNLESCPSGAILFSFGDNDFYPVHYLQKTKGIRKDVYLVNSNLLAIDRYIFRATFPQYDALPIKISVDTSFYIGHKNEVIYIKDSSLLLPMSEFRYFLQQGNRDENNIITLAADNIGLVGTKERKGDVETGINRVLSLKDIKYLTRDQWILLDIIENLNGRKLCFPNLLFDQLQELNNHLKQKDDIWIYDN